MHSNCQKLKLPFEVLIQGPNGNRFVRKLVPEAETLMAVEQEPLVRRARSSPVKTKKAAAPVETTTKTATTEPTNESVPAKVNPKQSVIASISQKDVTTVAGVAEDKQTPTEASTSSVEPKETASESQPKETVPRGKREDAVMRDDDDEAAREEDAVVGAARDEGMGQAAREDEEKPAARDDAAVARDDAVKDRDDAAVARDDAPVVAQEDDKGKEDDSQVGSAIGLIPLQLLPIAKLPALSAIKQGIDLKLLHAKAAKDVAAAHVAAHADVLKHLAGAKFIAAPLKLGPLGAHLAAGKAAAIGHLDAFGSHLKALKVAKLPVFPAIL